MKRFSIGDEVVVRDCRGSKLVKVLSAGRRWFTVSNIRSRVKFDLTTGANDTGYQFPYVVTVAEDAETRERSQAQQVLRAHGIEARHSVPAPLVKALAEALKVWLDERAGKVSP